MQKSEGNIKVDKNAKKKLGIEGMFKVQAGEDIREWVKISMVSVICDNCYRGLRR